MHRKQPVHLSLSSSGYRKPSSFSAMWMASWGQSARQAVQPQHSSFFSYRTGKPLFVKDIIDLFSFPAGRRFFPTGGI